MIGISEKLEHAFDRMVKADAFEPLESFFKSQLLRTTQQYEQAKESLVVSGDRVLALQLRGKVTAYTEIVDLFARQKV